MCFTHHILVEEIEDHVSQTSVTPMAVNQNELSQELESRDSKVTGHHRLYMEGDDITIAELEIVGEICPIK